MLRLPAGRKTSEAARHGAVEKKDKQMMSRNQMYNNVHCLQMMEQDGTGVLRGLTANTKDEVT